ncbi:MAG: peptidylprolyl isomerase [Actinomycetes bacterium]
MGTNAEKHARQQDHRNRLNAAQAELEAKARKRKILSIVGGVIAVLVLIGAVVLLTGKNSEDTASSTTTTTAADASSTTVPGEPSDGAAVLPDPPAGATLTEPTTCPPADGSAERVQVFASPPPNCLQAGAKYTATFDTTEGSFTAKLDSAAAPKAVNNFVVLSRYHYYDGVPFHRIVAGFVIQAGDGDGAPWGNNELGYKFEDELPKSSDAYTDYSLAMANSGPNTNGSQFFVVLPAGGKQLQPLYTFFGQVTEGTEVVDTIGALGTPSQEPSKAVIINSVTINET